MVFTSHFSSSAGNAYTISDGETRILIECGVSRKRLIRSLDCSIADYEACLVSHEHKDHSKSVQELISRGTKVYMSQGTAEALNLEGVEAIEAFEQLRIGTFDVVPFATFHDAIEPIGFLIKSRVDGESLAFATDTVNIRYRFPGLNILAIEANYSKAILDRNERMPEKVRRRITNTHMEIDTLCDYLRSLDLRDCREIYLLHLSDASSHEKEFIKKVASAVPKGIAIKACRK